MTDSKLLNVDEVAELIGVSRHPRWVGVTPSMCSE